ncbi:putative membrane protein [Rhizobium sp. RU20A]|uniref:YcjF family protein n=1 Tax=Rhizobium sp. RU20A TaxID=1907412 RepID=UPI000954F58A|nr:TIGR01620 family protein [Rhizobium sp. RU20A]SIQ13317.1 putative membrane protein [Rhizobium sp. RU20A]
MTSDTDIPRRRPAAIRLDEPAAQTSRAEPAAPRKPAAFDEQLAEMAADQDIFDDALPPAVPARRRRAPFASIALGGAGILVSLGVGLWIDGLIADLFARADWLGYVALAAAAFAILGVTAIGIREFLGLRRLAVVQDIKADLATQRLKGTPKTARAEIDRLATFLSHRPETAAGRARLKEGDDDIIDASDLVDLAERELLAPLDRIAKRMTLDAAKRVSVVTAVSPRAIVDLAYVGFEAVRLVRGMADLYGGRPGTFGMLRLMRDVLAHLAVTGSIAVGDSLVQEVVGHGIASRLSAKLGEGVVNGLMTARIGIAAMDLCRPVAFSALARPRVADVMAEISPLGRDRKAG